MLAFPQDVRVLAHLLKMLACGGADDIDVDCAVQDELPTARQGATAVRGPASQ